MRRLADARRAPTAPPSSVFPALIGRSAPRVQAALRLGRPDDPHERQADRLADEVMRRASGPAAGASPPPMATDPAPLSGGGVAPPAVEAVVASPGQPLDAGTRAYFEHRLGHDFSRIRIHRDAGAAASADAVQAHAYTVGSHIAFGPGAYRPDTAAGRRLLAHELVHTLQQGGTAAPAPVRVQRVPRDPLGTPFPAAVVLYFTPLRQTPTDTGTVIERLDAWHAVTVKGGSTYLEVETVVGGVTRTGYIHHNLLERPDQRSGTQVPDADQQKRIGAELDPGAFVPGTPAAPTSSGPPPPAPPPTRVVWDGHSSQANYQANRAALRTKLRAGLAAFVTAEKPSVQQQKTLARIAMQKAGTGAMAGKDVGVQGVATAASGVLEQRYGSVMNAAVRTPSQTATRQAPMSASPGARGQNLFDAYSKAQRKRALGIATDTELAFGVAWWALQNDPSTASHLKSHHLTPGWHPRPPTEEWTFTQALINRFIAQGSNRADLVAYRLFRWNETTDKGILLLTTVDPATQGGDAVKAERARRWGIFSSSIHETVHFRTHPAFARADRGRSTMLEGFTEMFAKDAADPALTRVRAGSDEPLRTAVEGAVAPIDGTVIPASKAVAPQYLNAWNHARAVRAEVGENAVRAAYFQGHVELLGLQASGADMPGLRAAGTPFEVSRPPGVNNLAELATASGLSVAEIQAANPGITNTLPAEIALPGCREHIVVGTTDSRGVRAVEERRHIAAQHGVDESALIRANPGLAVRGATRAWPRLGPGQKILIPRR